LRVWALRECEDVLGVERFVHEASGLGTGEKWEKGVFEYVQILQCARAKGLS
jgi:hypothetical protein